MIAGHEISGIIEKIGRDVKDWKNKDEVALSPVIHCGKCFNCRLGKEHYCIDGKVIGGEGQKKFCLAALQNMYLFRQKFYIKKPKNVTFEAVALAEPLAGSYKGLIEYTNFRIGEDIVIIGAGWNGTFSYDACCGIWRRQYNCSRYFFW